MWGNVRAGEKLEVVSQMPQDGVIFSDGVEADFLAFDSGAVAGISVAEEKASLQRRAKRLASYAPRAISTQQSAVWLPTAES